MNKKTKSPTPNKQQSNQKYKRQTQKDYKHKQFNRSLSAKSQIAEETSKITDLTYLFKKKIKSIIQLQESIDERRLPQRCQIHNSAYSLYSENERSLVCATCIYQKDKKKTNLIPISQATQHLKQDINRNKEKINKKINQLAIQIKKTQQNLQRIQSQFPQYIVKLQRHYTNLHEVLVRKEKQHINQIRYLKDKSIYEHVAVTTELNNIIHYIIQKMQDQITIDDYKLPFQHSIFNVLAQCQSVVKCQRPASINSSIISSTSFSTAGDFLIKNLTLSNPENQKIQQKKKIQAPVVTQKEINKGNRKKSLNKTISSRQRSKSQSKILSQVKKTGESQNSFQKRTNNDDMQKTQGKKKTPSKVRSYLQRSSKLQNSSKKSIGKLPNEKKSLGKSTNKKNSKELEVQYVNKGQQQQQYSFDKSRQKINQNSHKKFLNIKKQEMLKSQRLLAKNGL